MLAAVALGATPGNYKGQTRQRDPRTHHHLLPLPIAFYISHTNTVVDLRFDIDDVCPDGHLIVIHSYGYPAISIVNGRFRGSYGVAGGKPGEGSTVSGTVSGRTVSGSLTDTAWSPRERAMCRGVTSYQARLG